MPKKWNNEEEEQECTKKIVQWEHWWRAKGEGRKVKRLKVGDPRLKGRFFGTLKKWVNTRAKTIKLETGDLPQSDNASTVDSLPDGSSRGPFKNIVDGKVAPEENFVKKEGFAISFTLKPQMSFFERVE